MTLEETIADVVARTLTSQLDRLLSARERTADAQANGRRFFREREVAAMLGISATTLRHWRNDGLVTPSRPRKPVLYSLADIDAVAELLTNEGGS